MDKPQNVIQTDPADLTVHPDSKKMPEMPNDSEEFLALVDDIADRGIDQPLLIDKQNRIVDGKNRWRAARRLQLKLVPTILVPDTDVASIIIGTLLNRRHYSKGARAYLAYPLMQKAWEEAVKRKQECLKRGGSTLSALRDTKTVEELAESIGIGRTLFIQARDVHEAFEKKPKLREQFESDILTGETGLGAVKAGIAGQEKTKDKPRNQEDQFELFTSAWDTLNTRFKYWRKFDEEEKTEAIEKLQKTIKAMPPELRGELKKTLAAIEKEEKANA